MREQWDKWGWIIPSVVIVIGILRLLYGREPFCASGPDEHCLREWMSALGGWAAVGAAIPTVFFLSRQIASADRHHKEAMGLQLLRFEAIADGSKVILDFLKPYSDTLKTSWDEINQVARSGYSATRNEMIQELSGVLAQCSNAYLKKLEEEIGAPNRFSYDHIQGRLKRSIEFVEKLESDELTGGPLAVFSHSMALTYQQVSEYAAACQEVVATFNAQRALIRRSAN